MQSLEGIEHSAIHSQLAPRDLAGYESGVMATSRLESCGSQARRVRVPEYSVDTTDFLIRLKGVRWSTPYFV